MSDPTLPPSSPPAFEPPHGLTEIPTENIDLSPTGLADDTTLTKEIIRTPSRFTLLAKRLGWVGIGLGFFVFFTIAKLPDEQIKAYIQNTISSQLADQGMSLTANETSFSIFLGLTYKMKEVTLTTQTGAPVKLEELSFSPSLLPLLLGKLGGSFKLVTPGGQVEGAIWSKNTKYGIKVNTSDFDVKKSQLLQALGGFSAGAKLTLDASIDGDTLAPSETDGSAKLRVEQLVIDPQTIFGFSIPRISISETKTEIQIEKGKAQIKTFQIGKNGGKTEDIHATATGTIALARRLEMSTLDIKTKFGFSENVMKSFILLDSLLGQGKQSDGSYAFHLTGMLANPTPLPLTP